MAFRRTRRPLCLPFECERGMALRNSGARSGVSSRLNLDRLKESSVRKEFVMSKAIEIEELATATTNDPRWLSVVERDKTAVGTFYYSVKTTGVYCRPSCAARLARPENVQFHQTPEDAEKAGFRACKRRKPTGPSLTEENAARIAKACRLIERSQDCPSWEQVAKDA